MIRLILTLLLPPIAAAVYAPKDKAIQFIFNIILCTLGYIPAVIHAFILAYLTPSPPPRGRFEQMIDHDAEMYRRTYGRG